MNSDTKERLVWNAIPTMFDDICRPSDIPNRRVRKPPRDRTTVSTPNDHKMHESSNKPSSVG